MITTFGKRTGGDPAGKITVSGPELGHHIAFVLSMLDKYEWEESAKAHIQTILSEIIKKQEDKLLSLCVVGEFSSGKSTFINALLRRDDLLVSSALQGTTVAATVLEDSRNYRLILEYRDGRNEKRYFTDAHQLKNALPEYTTDPEKAKDIKYVRIGLPAKNLTRGFRVIDTPGTNSTDPMHEKITGATIKERADMSVLVIDANKPLSETFCTFIKMNFSKEALDNCIFVVTRIDMIRQKEREGVLSFLRNKISAEFGIDEPVVLPFASTHVLDCMDKPKEETDELAIMSLASEDTMLLCMAKKKEAAQRKKLIALADDMYKSLSEKLSGLSEKHNEKLEKLTKSENARLEPFTKEQIKLRTAGYTEKARCKHLEIRAKLDGYIETATKNIMRRADTANTPNELRTFLKTGLPMASNTEREHLTRAAQMKFSVIGDCFESEMDIFRKEFDRLFGDLSSLGSSPAVIKHEKLPIPWLGNICPVPMNASDSTLAVAKGRDAKKNVMRKLEPEVRHHFENVCIEIEQSLERYIQETCGAMTSGINAYLGVYRDAAKKRAAEHEDRITKVKDDINSIAEDIKKAESLKAELRTDPYDVSFAEITEQADILGTVAGNIKEITDTKAFKNNASTPTASTKKRAKASIDIETLLGIGSDKDKDDTESMTGSASKEEDDVKSIMEKFSYGFGGKG